MTSLQVLAPSIGLDQIVEWGVIHCWSRWGFAVSTWVTLDDDVFAIILTSTAFNKREIVHFDRR
jgi:hypothetical protein